MGMVEKYFSDDDDDMEDSQRDVHLVELKPEPPYVCSHLKA